MRPQPQPQPPRVPETPDSVMTSPYPASEYSDWESEGGEKTPTRAQDYSSLTVQELQAAASKLNLCLVTPQSPPTLPPMSPTMSPTMSSIMQPTMSPNLPPTMQPTMPPTMPAPVAASLPPVVPPRQRTEAEPGSAGNQREATECMTQPWPPTSNNQPTNTDPGKAPLHPTDSDNPPADTNNDNTDTSDDDEDDCQTVRLNDNKSFAQTEMKFRDIYDDIVAILPSSSGNDISQSEPTSTLSSAVDNKIISQSSQPITDKISPPTELRTTLVEAEKVREVFVEADLESSLVKGESEISLTNPFYEAAVEKISESTETITQTQEDRERLAGERKPRSSKKSRAPPPPSLLSPSDQIIHLSPAVSPATTRRNQALEETEITPEPEVPVISASLGAENGKIIYRSKGFSEETILADTLPQKVELVTPSPTVLPEYSAPDLPETKPVSDPYPDKEWKFLGQSDIIEDKDLLKPVSDKLYSRASDTPSENYPIVPASTRLFTYSPSTGVTKLRKYDLGQEVSRPASPPVRGERTASPVVERPERPLSPLLPRSEYYGGGEEGTSRCPHCTIHSWLPHSPGCLNKRK